MKPLCIDLFCGLGGWAYGFIDAGYHVVGYDIDSSLYSKYPGDFIRADVRDLDGHFPDAVAIVASPPCQEFSDMRFLRKNPKEPDMSCVEAAFRIRKQSGVPTVIENVRGARRFFPEPCVTHRGAYYLWGDVPLIDRMKVPMKVGAVARARNPDGTLKPSIQRQWGAKKPDKSKNGQRLRAMIPYSLAYPIALGMLTATPKEKQDA